MLMSTDTPLAGLYLEPNTTSGYILIIYSCLISFALILFAGAYLGFQENQIRQMEREISSIKAFYIAQAGLKKIAGLNETELEEDFGGGSYEVISAMEEYTSVGQFKGVKRTLQADIEREGTETGGYFEGAVYVHHDFGTMNLPGFIDGKNSSYALQIGDIIISRELFLLTLKGPIIQRTQRSGPNYPRGYRCR